MILSSDLFGKTINNRKPSENVLGQAGVSEFMVHDLRRPCRTLMSSLGVREEVAELCLNHSASNIVRTYNRYEYKNERREAHTKLARLILPMASFAVTE